MTTAVLESRLRHDVELVARVNAAVWIACGAALLAVPTHIAAVLDTASLQPNGARAVGVVLLSLGVGLAVFGRRPLDRRAVDALAVVDAVLALGVLAAPFALRAQPGFLVWILLAVLFFALQAGATAWLFTRDRMVVRDRRLPPQGAAEPLASPPASDDGAAHSSR